MKKLVTGFVIAAIAFTAMVSYAETVGRVAELRPDGWRPRPVSAPFLMKKKFVFLGTPKHMPLGEAEALAYYNPDMFDDQGALVDGAFTFYQLPDTAEITSTTQPEADGTYIFHQMMERFTSTFTDVYLDSVRIAFRADTIATTRIAVFVYQDTVNQNGLNTPNYYYLNAQGRPVAQIANASILKADILTGGDITDYTVNFNHKKLELNEASPGAFYVALSVLSSTNPGPNGGNPFFATPASKNRLGLLGDYVLDAAGARDYDPEIDRAYFSRTRTDAQWTWAAPMFGFYGNDLDGDPTNGLEEVLYPNFFMIAYVSNSSSGVEDIRLEGDALAQNYPNPFNPSTNIAYSLGTSGQASLKVYNALGNEVATLLNGYQTAGKHEVMFDASELPTGTYYYTLKSGSFISTKRMVLSK